MICWRCHSEHGAILERLGEVIRRMEDLVKN